MHREEAIKYIDNERGLLGKCPKEFSKNNMKGIQKIISSLKDCEFKSQLAIIKTEAEKLKKENTEAQKRKIISLIKAAKEKIMTIDEKVLKMYTQPSRLAATGKKESCATISSLSVCHADQFHAVAFHLAAWQNTYGTPVLIGRLA